MKENSIRDKIEPKAINAEPNYKEEYFRLQKENHMLEEEIKKYKEALLKICLKI